MKILKYRDYMKKEYWNSLQTRQELYDEFDPMREEERDQFTYDPELPQYYRDEEFKAAAQKLSEAAKPLVPVLKELLNHMPLITFWETPGIRDRQRHTETKLISDDIIGLFHGEEPDGLAILLQVMLDALDEDSATNIIKPFAEGNGIPEARAAFRAFRRYKAFKAADEEKLDAFKKTDEYKLQLMEKRLGLRKSIVVPEE